MFGIIILLETMAIRKCLCHKWQQRVLQDALHVELLRHYPCED